MYGALLHITRDPDAADDMATNDPLMIVKPRHPDTKNPIPSSFTTHRTSTLDYYYAAAVPDDDDDDEFGVATEFSSA